MTLINLWEVIATRNPIDIYYDISRKWSLTTCKAPGLSMQKYAPKPNKLIRDNAINRWHKASGSQSHEIPQPRVSELSINLSLSRWDSSSENSLIQKICNALCLNISDHSIIDLVCLFYLVVFHLSLLLIFVHCLDLNLKAVATVFLLWVFVLRYSVTSMEQGAPAPQCSPLKHIKGDGSFLAILSKFDHHHLQSQSHWISIVFFGRLQWFPTLRWYASFVHGGVGHQQTPKQVEKVHPKIFAQNIISFQYYII